MAFEKEVKHLEKMEKSGKGWHSGLNTEYRRKLADLSSKASGSKKNDMAKKIKEYHTDDNNRKMSRASYNKHMAQYKKWHRIRNSQ